MPFDSSYDLRSVPAPRLAGARLRQVVALAEHPLTQAAITAQLRRAGGVPGLLDDHVDDAPLLDVTSVLALPAADGYAPVELDRLTAALPERPGSIGSFLAGYRAGTLDPERVAQQVLAQIVLSDQAAQPLRVFIAVQAEDVMAQARAAAARWQAGRPCGPLDGVPVAIKDEVDQRGYGTTVGTRLLGGMPAHQDATAVARLRAAGAVLVGKTNMHEIGIGVTGLNPHHGVVRNPYHADHHTGGSSSGSAAAVAAGLCPLALAADGGGSIRIPAALCGVVGLKPTYGRISTVGAAPLDWSVGHLGPIGSCAADVALGYAVMAGPDAADLLSLRQPPVVLPDFANTDLTGVRIGVYEAWLQDAQPAVVQVCRAMLAYFASLGATLVPITIPHLNAVRVAHAVTILTEMATALDRYHAQQEQFGLEARLNLALGRSLTSRFYVHAQRIRARALREWQALMQKVDVVLTPATARTAPRIMPDALPLGESNLDLTTALMRFAVLPNLIGTPAISFPGGYDALGLPIGVQLIGRHWEEHLLLHLAALAEHTVRWRKPQRWYGDE